MFFRHKFCEVEWYFYGFVILGREVFAMLNLIECNQKVWCNVFYKRIGDWALFFFVRWIFWPGSQPVFKNPLLSLGVPAGGHCPPVRGVVSLIVAYSTFVWPLE